MVDALVLEKLTLLYIEGEDRVKVQGQTKGGDKITLWFTQRLLLKLMPVLIGHLDRKVETGSDLSAPVSTLPAHRAAMQSFLQDKAMAGRDRSGPVVITEKPLVEHLVATMNISQQKNGVVLKFPLADDRFVALPLDQKHIRHWLGMMYSLFVKADWPLHIWPEWVRGEHNAKTKSDLGQLH